MTLSVDTHDYENTHGKKPYGFGNWRFEFKKYGSCLMKDFAGRAYGNARSEALADAKEYGAEAVVLLP